MKKYLIIAGIIVFIALVSAVKIQHSILKKRKAEINRLESNNTQLIEENRAIVTLNVKYKELSAKEKSKSDSLAKVLKIKPKQIEKIVYQIVTIHDTIIKPVQVTEVRKEFWQIQDKDKCFTWEADAYLRNDSLILNRTLFDYSNETTSVYYRERPKRFLFIKYGKFINKQRISSTCGGVTEKTFQFIK